MAKRMTSILLPVLLVFASCEPGDGPGRGQMTEGDTASHLAKADSAGPESADSIPPAVEQYFAGTQIDTRDVHPEAVVEFARTLIGVPYQYASSDPKAGFDCSGFITYVFNRFDIAVPRSSIDFTNVGTPVESSDARPGDLILFTGTDSTEKFVGHMGLVVENGAAGLQFIHSTSGKKYGVTVSPLSGYYSSRYVKTIRIFKP